MSLLENEISFETATYMYIFHAFERSFEDSCAAGTMEKV